MHSELAAFIEQNTAVVLDAAIVFAKSVQGGKDLDDTTLRDHLPEILQAVVADLRTGQTRAEEIEKSEGRVVPAEARPRTAAGTHALHRAQSGYSISGLVSEYRALRASVLRLWSEARGDEPVSLPDVIRFNEAIDEAIAESVRCYALEVERWRDLFLGVLGHELRNPLNAIVLTSELISRLSMDTPIAPVASRLRSSGEQMTKLLNKLLSYNRAQLGIGILIEKTEVDLVAELRQELELLQSAMPGARIEFHGPDAMHGSFDAAHLREVLANLVVNAQKYGARGKVISVGLSDGQDAMELVVSNFGEPIAAETFDQMFDPLRRGGVAESAEADRISLGLGLFIARQIATAHGGSISAESGNGRTTFMLLLPRGTEPQAD